MPATWIDFKQLKQDLTFEQVLKHFGVTLTVKGDQATGLCPLPGHDGEKKPSFSASMSKGIFQCFGCKAKGNLLDFSVLMAKKDPKNMKDVRAVALTLLPLLDGKSEPKAEKSSRRRAREAPAPSDEKTVRVNEPLDFTLQDLDPSHPYLRKRGLSPKTIAHFGLGFCSRGLMKDRIAIPLHDDPHGRLIGYAGRLVDDKKVSATNPKYKLPSGREHGGIVHEFRKSLFLYNGHRLQKPVTRLIVVEGFPGVWHLYENGYPEVVALMGSSCSDEQALLIVQHTTPDGEVWVMPDGNQAGEDCAVDVLKRIAPHRLVRWIALPPEAQPTDFNQRELAERFP